MPPTKKPVDPKRVHEMDFSTAKKCIEDLPMAYRDKNRGNQGYSGETYFIKKFRRTSDSVLHLVTKPFSVQHMQVTSAKKSLRLNVLYNEKHETLSLTELQELGNYLINNFSNAWFSQQIKLNKK